MVVDRRTGDVPAARVAFGQLRQGRERVEGGFPVAGCNTNARIIGAQPIRARSERWFERHGHVGRGPARGDDRSGDPKRRPALAHDRQAPRIGGGRKTQRPLQAGPAAASTRHNV